MGVYDTIIVGDREGQVKLSDDFATYRVGDTPAWFLPFSSYSIAMREGGFVNVTENHIVSWTDAPEHAAVIDKYGGSFGGPYLFNTEPSRG